MKAAFNDKMFPYAVKNAELVAAIQETLKVQAEPLEARIAKLDATGQGI